ARKSAGSANRGVASRWNAAPRRPIAISAATSPYRWPPSPSATAISRHSGVDQDPTRSWLMRRAPMRLSWASAYFMAFGALLAEQRLLQREHALRPLEVLEAQAPVDDVEQLLGVFAFPGAPRGDEDVFFQPLVRGLRRGAGEAGIGGGAHGVDVGPGAELALARV